VQVSKSGVSNEEGRGETVNNEKREGRKARRKEEGEEGTMHSQFEPPWEGKKGEGRRSTCG
jgi:hypothetical protein